ncbi:MAG TPA: hypothetical protein VKP30_24200 [Polyangiaceae bacterium]|nr:hypothetical protein [Polyangiaceae bacterium]
MGPLRRLKPWHVVVCACLAAETVEACPLSGREWIGIEFDSTHTGSSVDTEARQLQSKVVEHLQAEFRPQNIDVCTNPEVSAGPALATIRIERDATNAAHVRARADDAVTQKELSRRLSLDGLPRDAHAMAIALGASELLRASWVELKLQSRALPSKAPPPSVERAVASHEKDAPNAGKLGISAAAEAFSGGVEQAGVNAELWLELSRIIEASVRFGGRTSTHATAAHGTIAGNGWLLGVGSRLELAKPAPNLSLSLELCADLMRVTFSGKAIKGAVASAESGTTAWVSLGLGSDWRVTRQVFLSGGVLLGRVVVPVIAADDGKRIQGFTQGLVAAHAGIKIPF